MQAQKQGKQSQVYSREEYGSKQFWENRYKENPGYFDWYAEFPELKETFENFYNINKQQSILNIGCGNSKLSDQMYQAGYHNILNMDISPSVIQQMAQTSKQKGYDKMKWEVMDATDMKQVNDESFDIALDKGTLDALIAGKNFDICDKMMRETMRVIKNDGQFLLITHGSPEGRKKLFESALGFQKYDYYVTKVDLNTMGTLINLMRSNLGNKPLNSIMNDKQALQKSMLEFNLIQMLRKKQKNEKKYVIWGDYQRKNVVFSEQQEEQSKTQQQPKGEDQQEGAEKKVTYNPKKQCYCFVYSIQKKFAANLLSQIPLQKQNLKQFCQSNSVPIQNNKIVFENSQRSPSFAIVPKDGSEIVSIEIVRALLYLKKNKIPNNPITIYLNPQDYEDSKENIKFNLKAGDINYTPVYTKSVVQLAFPASSFTTFKALQQKLTDLGELLTQQLNLHPSTFQYAFLGILFQKKSPGNYYHKLLKKFWYPTHQFSHQEDDSIIYEFSLPPSADIQKCMQLMKRNLRECRKMQIMRKGYVSYLEPKLFNHLTLCSQRYGEQEQFRIIVEQFIESEPVEDYSSVPTIVMKEAIIAKSLARILSRF